MSTVIQQISADTTIVRTLAVTEIGNPGPQGPAGDAVEIALARRHDWQAPYSYCGKATGTPLDSDPVWTITRIELAADGTTTTTQAVNVAWDDRLTATYI
jgi:hypothetical protein